MWFQVLQISEETLSQRQFQKSTNTKMSGLYFKWRDNLNLMQGRKKSGVVSEKKETCSFAVADSLSQTIQGRKLDFSISIFPPKLHLLPLMAFHVLLIPSFAAIILRSSSFGELIVCHLRLKTVIQVWSTNGRTEHLPAERCSVTSQRLE